ncbi:TonB-dependent receptor domain-containing protein [Parabacteroides sp. AM08-6]|uniref:TonB-dependent receptor n=1 Tax=Parabacteroides sp. AM08-6 TaxID=2292053 RepID=UPI000F002726|nr:TonB-dependent receptor [Parabacteroides sp. AM08-6]RHJ78383.1 TonB-dependent receptor [Parabacteroides sp. AM08-6]
MKKLYTITILLLFLSVSAFGQTLKGHIYDAETSEPLIGVNVTYNLHGTQGVVSDEDGAYSIELPEGGVDLVFSYIGYEDVQLPVVIGKRQVQTKDIYMKVGTNLLEDIVVSAGRFEQKLSDITVSMDLLKTADISKQAPTDLSASLKTLPGVDVNDTQPSIRGGAGWAYGVGARSQILVDGMSILTPGSGEINWNIIPMENVAQVEIIKGASSVLYGSSALNGVINVRTARPGLTPITHIGAYVGIYGDPSNENYRWSDKTFWKDGKYPVEPILRNSLLTGVRNPVYEGLDFSHSRRIGNFDVTGGMNLFTDEGYRQQSFNKRFRMGGNLTYHQPDMGEKIMNYGFNANFLSDKYGDFFLWRSPQQAYSPSPFANMGREENAFYIDPFFNYVNPEKQISHKVKGRFYYRGDNIFRPSQETSITDIMGNMGTDLNAIQNIVNGDLSLLYPIIQPALQGDLNGAIDGVYGALGQIFPNATTADYCDLIAYAMNHGLPSGTSDLIPWLSGVINPEQLEKQNNGVDNNFTYYVDYQYNKRWDSGAQITTGGTLEHIRNDSRTTGIHKSDNVAAFFQYDQRFFDRLNVSAGVRAEYYRVDDFYRESDTKVFGTKIPVRPVFRAGLNYQLAQYSFLRASFGQGYRNPSITEKYARKDIGGVGVYPNSDVQAEKGYNAELGIKQGYKIGNLMGFIDLAGFYTQYTNMVEFQFGLFNNTTYKLINSIPDAIDMFTSGGGLGIGAQFHNVSKARIYGAEISTNGTYEFNKNARLLYNLGYVYIEPEDADYKERNEMEEAYTDPLQMKEKSNNSKYLKYRQKHTVKGTLDFQWKRINLGVNAAWKSRTLAVDYLMVDEREKPFGQKEIMDHVRDLLFGNIGGETLGSYWEQTNKSYFTMDLRAGVKVTKEVQFQFLINNLLNKEYSTRPMAVAAPRTFVMRLGIDF